MFKKVIIGVAAAVAGTAFFACDEVKEKVEEGLYQATTSEEDKQPKVIREAQRREDIRQDREWTPENIRKEPYLFVKDQISNCDVLKEKIETQKIAFAMLKNKADRQVSEAEAATIRYQKFLTSAKDAYKKASAAGTISWPLRVNDFELSEVDFNNNVAEALERLKLEENKRNLNLKISKKIEGRQNYLKSKETEIVNLRHRLTMEAENIKMKQAVDEIDSLKDALDVISDMAVQLAGDPEKFTLEDLTTENPADARQQSVLDFLNN